MRLPDDLSRHLRNLTVHAQHDLVATVEELLEATVVSIPTCLAVSVTVQNHQQPVTVTAFTPVASRQPVRSSLVVRLPAHPGSPQSGAFLAVYAGASGALHTTASALLALLDLDPRRAVLDAHLDLPARDVTTRELGVAIDDDTAVNRAIGILLDRHGLLPERGRSELARLAAASGTSVAAAARQVLRSASDEQ